MPFKMTCEPDDYEGPWPDLSVSVPAWKLVPIQPDDNMAGKLARDIVMWWCMSPPTGRMLHRHVRALHHDVPQWLADLIPDREVVPPKGAVACAIYRAMLDAAPAAPQQAKPVGYFQRDCDYFEQVEDVYQWDADVIPLYLHPPAAEVQRLREAAMAVVDAYRNIGPVTVAIEDLSRAL